MTVPLAGLSGLDMSSSTSACSRMVSSRSSTPCPNLALICEQQIERQ